MRYQVGTATDEQDKAHHGHGRYGQSGRFIAQVSGNQGPSSGNITVRR